MSILSLPESNEWVSKQAAAQRLNVSEKTIDRLAARGQLHKRSQRRPGLSTISVYHAGDLERILSVRSPAFISDMSGDQSPRDISQVLTPLSDTLVSLLGALTGVLQNGPLYIPLTEAASRLGLNERYVRQCVRSGKLRAVRLMVDGRRVTRVRAADLDAV